MLWSIDSCQNRASADQYHLTVPRAQVSTHRGRVFFEVIRWQITSFKWSQAQVYFFQWFIWNLLCLCHYGPALLRFWFQTDLGHKSSAIFLKKIQAGKTFSYHGHALRPIFMLWLVKIWKVSSCGKLCIVLKLVYFDSWSWQSFVSTCDFLTVFFHWMYKMKNNCYQESSGLFIWFLFEKWVACQSRKADFGWHRFRFSLCLMRKRV